MAIEVQREVTKITVTHNQLFLALTQMYLEHTTDPNAVTFQKMVENGVTPQTALFTMTEQLVSHIEAVQE